MRYLVCIPTYNEALNIAKLVSAIFQEKLKDLDILVIDDNSPDGTGKIIEKISEDKKIHNKIFLLERKTKEGLGKAYIAGFDWGLKRNYDYILSMDADFSHDPKYLPAMLKQSPKYDLVIGSRYIKGGKIVGWDWLRYLNSWGANFFTKLILGLKVKDVTAGYKCYSAKFLRTLDLKNIISGGYAFQVEMINSAEESGFKTIELPIIFTDRNHGESKISGEFFRSIKAVFRLAAKKKIYHQIIKFGLVGVTGTIVDLGIYNLLAISLGINIYLARSISFVLAATNNYILNRKWTFHSQEKKIASEFGKFFFISVIGLGMNLVIMKLLVPLSQRFHSQLAQKNIPVLIAISIVLVWNFFANKFWTFKEKL